MREILFRGKRKDNGEWVQGQLLHFKASVGTEELAIIVEGCEWDNSNEWFNLGKRAKVFPETIGQYTGLTDKNGTKIFEGDIVESVYYHFKGVVIFDEYCRFVIKDVIEGGYYLVAHNNNDCIVIGNIHDNPELLGGAEQ